MKQAIMTSLSAAGALAGATGGVVGIVTAGLVTDSVSITPASMFAASGVGAALTFGAAQWAVRWRDAQVRRCAAALQADEPEQGAPTGPAWIAPITQAAMASRAELQARLRSAEAQLREIDIRRRITESERRQVEGTLHSLKDAVLVTDAFDELKMANQAAATLLGFDLDESVHKPLAEVIRDSALVRIVSEARETASAGDRRQVEYTMAPAGGGEQRAFDITICAIAQRDEQQTGVVTILRDVTREKEIAQMKSDFVSQVSHELRTPLSSINAYVEMLLDGEAADEASRQEFYEIIKNEADRLARLIDNMLNISRIEAGIIQVDWAEVNFVDVAREVVEIMQPQAKLKDITLVSKMGPMVYTAQACRDMIHQIMLNLVSNAVKYTPEGGRVTISVENDDATRSVLVTIADTGLGIPPDAVDKIFEKFYRIDSYKRVAKGTGLGLNLVKNIVETVHSGQVGVSSDVGLGSKFWFTIPYERAGARMAA